MTSVIVGPTANPEIFVLKSEKARSLAAEVEIEVLKRQLAAKLTGPEGKSELVYPKTDFRGRIRYTETKTNAKTFAQGTHVITNKRSGVLWGYLRSKKDVISRLLSKGNEKKNYFKFVFYRKWFLRFETKSDNWSNQNQFKETKRRMESQKEFSNDYYPPHTIFIRTRITPPQTRFQNRIRNIYRRTFVKKWIWTWTSTTIIYQ